MIVQRETRTGHVLHRFDNGYGASVISDGYGSGQGLLELGVIEWDGDDYQLTYQTPITSDVLGYLTAQEVDEALAKIAALEPADIRAESARRKRGEISKLRERIADPHYLRLWFRGGLG